MPVKDGFQAASEINIIASEGRLKYRPRITAVTAYSLEVFRQKAKSNKMDWFMTKPIKLKTLKKVMNNTFEWMGRR